MLLQCPCNLADLHKSFYINRIAAVSYTHLDVYKRQINIHPSLIPSFCGEGFYGLKVHEQALARGVT